MQIADVIARLSKRPPQSVIAFVGAGLSRDLGFPLWAELIAKLADFVEPFWAPHAATMRHRLRAGDLVGAADPAFEREVPANDRAGFVKSIFERYPDLNRRHRLLGALPVAAFVTTNFDCVIERAVGVHQRLARVFQGPERFTTFNSALPTYIDKYPARWEKEVYVLKLHNDTTDPEHLVLNSRSFAELPGIRGFKHFFDVALRNFHVVFLGFGGEDPNLLDRVTELFAEYAGYGPQDSYLLIPEGTRAPVALSNTNIQAALYDPKDGHTALEDLLKALNDAWRGNVRPPLGEERLYEERADELAIRAVADEADLTRVNIFELMVASFKSGSDRRILDSVATALVAAAASAAQPHTNPRSIANQISQKYRLSPERAAALVDKYLSAALTLQAPAGNAAEPLRTLSQGLRQRCLAHDPDFLPTERVLEPVVRSTVEFALQAYGCSVALALVNGDRPLLGELSDVVRTILREQKWDGIGDVERESLSLAIPDLFLHPTELEANVLSKLAVAATSFGLLQALPLEDIGTALTPRAVYLDTTCALPLLTKAQPRCSAYAPLLPLADKLGIKLLFLRSFLTEISSHFARAMRAIREQRLETVGKVRDYLAGGLEEYINVFLVMLAQSDNPDDTRSASTLARLFGSGTDDEFAKRVEQQSHVRLVDAPKVEATVLEALTSRIIVSKKNWYERSAAARTILARNEALQLLQLDAEAKAGQASWFATGDSQLRRVVRENDAPAAQYVLPVGGAIALLESLSTGEDLSVAFPRMLWSPDISDQVDQQLSLELKRLVSGDALERGRLPIGEARKLALEEALKRVRADRAPDDLELDTAPRDTHVIIRESVYLGLGQAIEHARREEEKRQRPPKGRGR